MVVLESSMTQLETSIQGFLTLPVKFSADYPSHHVLYYKENRTRGKNEMKPPGKTLFVINIPPYCDQESLRRVFSDFGSVRNVYFHQKPNANIPPREISQYFKKSPPIKGFKVAYIVFSCKESLQKALALNITSPKVLSSELHTLCVGMESWIAEYSHGNPDMEKLKEEVDKYMNNFNEKEQEEKQEQTKTLGVPDEEGWITVTRTGKKSGIAHTDKIQKRLLVKEKKKRAQKELLNFYRFQIRDSKMNHLAELRKKFEEDKQKIALMKASRKFKPY